MIAHDELRPEKRCRLREEEGRPDGRHDDHWRQAGVPPLTEQASEDVTKRHREGKQQFVYSDKGTKVAGHIKPASAISLD